METYSWVVTTTGTVDLGWDWRLYNLATTPQLWTWPLRNSKELNFFQMFHSPWKWIRKSLFRENILDFYREWSPTKHYKQDIHYDIPSDVCFASKNQPKKAEICAGYMFIIKWTWCNYCLDNFCLQSWSLNILYRMNLMPAPGNKVKSCYFAMKITFQIKANKKTEKSHRL